MAPSLTPSSSATSPAGRTCAACPDGFWRKGNVDIVARRHRIRAYESLDALIAAVRQRVDELRLAR